MFLRTVIAKWYWPKYGSPCIHSYYFIMRILYAFERFVNNYYHVKKINDINLFSSLIVLILAHMGCLCLLVLRMPSGQQFNHWIDLRILNMLFKTLSVNYSRKRSKVLPLKFEYFTKFSFRGRFTWSKNGHNHPVFLAFHIFLSTSRQFI